MRAAFTLSKSQDLSGVKMADTTLKIGNHHVLSCAPMARRGRMAAVGSFAYRHSPYGLNYKREAVSSLVVNAVRRV